MSLSADDKGQFYAINWEGDKLLTVDKKTGAITGEKAIVPAIPTEDYQQGGCVNSKNGTYLQTYYTDDAAGLIQIDLATGASTELTQFPNHEQFIGLYIAPPLAEDKAPNTPGIYVVSQNGEMDAHITLGMPSDFYDGTDATGQTFNYIVYADGEEILTGSALAGSSVERTATFTTSGRREFSVVLSNEVGKSPTASISCFIGIGRPSTPSNVKVEWADGVATLTWSPVFYASDSGYFNPDEVTYTIYDLEKNVLVESTTELSYTVQVPEPEGSLSLKYYVRANFRDRSSDLAGSNTIILGDLTPPLSIDLKDEDLADMHNVSIDGNEDNISWMQHYLRGMCITGSDKGHDDWLFTPAIYLAGGKTYKFSAFAQGHISWMNEKLEVKAGMENTVEGMTMTVIAPTEVNDSSTPINGYITAKEDGYYYIGFHAMSQAGTSLLYLEEYSISAPIDACSPAEVTDVTITPDFDGELNANVSFKMPTVTVDGDPLPSDVKVNVYVKGVLYETYDRPLGSEVSFVYNASASGSYIFRFVTLDTDGNESKDYTETVFIGPRLAGDPQNVTLLETGADKYLLSWDAVTTDRNGEPIKPEYISYIIRPFEVSADGFLVLGDEIGRTTDTTFDYSPAEHIAEQGYLLLAVAAVNRDREPDFFQTGRCWTGDAYDMPVTYTDASEEYQFSFESDIPGSDIVLVSSEQSGIPAQDEDGCMLAVKSTTMGQKSVFTTGLINIDGEEPTFSFYARPLHGQAEDGRKDNNETEVSIICDGEEARLLQYSNLTLPADEWTKFSVNLAGYKGKKIRISIKTLCNGYILSLYDNITVADASNTLVSGVDAETTVSVNGHVINVVTPEDKNVGIFSIEGRTIFSGNGTASVEVDPGIYLVKAGVKTTTILVH